MVDSETRKCAVCGNGDGEAPLIALTYRGSSMWICPQHMPALIHSPEKLAGVLPGAENLEPGDGD